MDSDLDFLDSSHLKFPVLANLSRAQLVELLRNSKTQDLANGDVLFSEGSTGNSIYIILKGEVVACIRYGLPSQKKLARLKPGESFGEIAMLTGIERTSTMVALTPCRVLQISKAAVDAAGVGGVFFHNVARVLAARLAKMNAKASKDPDFTETLIMDASAMQSGDPHAYLKQI